MPSPHPEDSTGLAMPSPPPEERTWLYDSIPHYRLNEGIIKGYLKNKWDDYQFFVEVCMYTVLIARSRPRRF